MSGESYDGELPLRQKIGCIAAAALGLPLTALLVELAEVDWNLFFGTLLVLVGIVPITYGLVTGAMPPFWDKYKNPRDWRTADRKTEPSEYWANAAIYAGTALYGCYLIATYWYPGPWFR
jgi:hypothetical protein